jgi:S-adenosyl methyltransferase
MRRQAVVGPTYIEAGRRDPASIPRHPAVRGTLDFSQPVALMLVAVLHFFPDAADPATIVQVLLDALPSGSYLVASQTTADLKEACMTS